jgi:Tfp pilus assembly PilM family ATPase
MLINWLQRKFVAPGCVGIDIGAESVGALMLVKHRSGFYGIKDFAFLPLTATKSENKNLFLKKLPKSFFANKKPVVSALPAADVINKEIELQAKLKAKEIYQLLELNLEKYLGFASSVVNFDYSVLEKNMVGIVAARRETIRHQQNIFAEAGLRLKIIDVDLLALERVAHWHQSEQLGVCAFLDFNTTRFLLCVLVHGQLVYSKADYFILAQDISEETLLQKAAQSLQMFNAVCHHHLERVILFGAATKPKDFAKKLADILHLPVNVKNPFQGIALATHLRHRKSDFNKIASKLTICFGLALRGLVNADH